jgi:hypothetical protein
MIFKPVQKPLIIEFSKILLDLKIILEFICNFNPNNPVVILRSHWSLLYSDSADRGRSIIRVNFNLAYVAEFQYKTGLLLTESRFISRFIYRNVIPLCKLLIILCGFYMKNNNSYIAHFVPVSFVYSI